MNSLGKHEDLLTFSSRLSMGVALFNAHRRAWMTRRELRDDQWERIKELLAGKASDPGRTATDNRKFVDAVLWITRTGTSSQKASVPGTACLHKSASHQPLFHSAVYLSTPRSVNPFRYITHESF